LSIFGYFDTARTAPAGKKSNSFRVRQCRTLLLEWRLSSSVPRIFSALAAYRLRPKYSGPK
jgi:hypothetical protein